MSYAITAFTVVVPTGVFVVISLGIIAWMIVRLCQIGTGPSTTDRIIRQWSEPTWKSERRVDAATTRWSREHPKRDRNRGVTNPYP